MVPTTGGEGHSHTATDVIFPPAESQSQMASLYIPNIQLDIDIAQSCIFLPYKYSTNHFTMSTQVAETTLQRSLQFWFLTDITLLSDTHNLIQLKMSSQRATSCDEDTFLLSSGFRIYCTTVINVKEMYYTVHVLYRGNKTIVV